VWALLRVLEIDLATEEEGGITEEFAARGDEPEGFHLKSGGSSQDCMHVGLSHIRVCTSRT
jgi:hypothetical protein